MTLRTRESIEALVTLTRLEKPRPYDVISYEVTRNTDGAFLGYVGRHLYKPDVNYPGTRIRKTFKGTQKWFAELPFKMQTGNAPRFARYARDVRWQAVLLLIEHWERL